MLPFGLNDFFGIVTGNNPLDRPVDRLRIMDVPVFIAEDESGHSINRGAVKSSFLLKIILCAKCLIHLVKHRYDSNTGFRLRLRKLQLRFFLLWNPVWDSIQYCG